MPWSKDSTVLSEDDTYYYNDENNILDENNTSEYTYKTNIYTFIEYIDKMLGISTSISNILDLLNVYEDDYYDNALKKTNYSIFINSLFNSMSS